MDQYKLTRVWMGGVPVDFVKWTPHGLIYTNLDAHDSLTTLSRKMVLRMMQDGLLSIEGYRPKWAYTRHRSDELH